MSPDRLTPQGLVDVAEGLGGAFDFRAERGLDGVEIDHAFTGLTRDGAGLASVRLRDRAGDGVVMSFDQACPWVQVHTADRPEPGLNRQGLAVEPMTCAPDAFNSGDGLVHLPPGRATGRPG